MERFFERPNNLWMLSRRFLAEFRASASDAVFPKDTIWLAAGQPCRELLLIQSGHLAAIQHTDDNPCITMLYGASNTVIAADSLFRKTVSSETYRFLDDSRVFTLEDRVLEALTLKYPDAYRLLHYFMGEELARQKSHNLMLSQYEPEERVAYAMGQFHEPFHLLNRGEQASFIGMTRRVYQRYI